MKITGLVATFLFAALQSIAHAASATTVWSIHGSACTVLSTSTGTASHEPFDTTFSGSSTGMIAMTCPVSAFQANSAGSIEPTDLMTTFIDTDGTTDTCSFNAYLYRYSAGVTASLTELAHYNGQTDTTLASTSPFNNYEDTRFSYTFDWDNNYYSVYVEMFRSSASCNVKFVGAQLLGNNIQ